MTFVGATIAWKNQPYFSTVWKTFFHSVEKMGRAAVDFSTAWKTHAAATQAGRTERLDISILRRGAV